MKNEDFRQFIEEPAFGVCSWIGQRLGVPSTTIRKYFIYASCLTIGSPVVLYLVMAFWLNLKDYIWKAKRNPLRYL